MSDQYFLDKMDLLEKARIALSSSVDSLETEGVKYAVAKREYLGEFAVIQARLSQDNSAAKAEPMAKAQLKDKLNEYEYSKTMFECMKAVVSARSSECNVLQSQIKALQQEWNQS